MGTYTVYDLPEVDRTVDTHMQLLAALCRDRFGDNLCSVVLAGSFGRGEGSVLIQPDGSVRPMRDYDVRVILNRPAASGAVDEVRQEFVSSTGLGSTSEHFSGETGFSLTVEPLTVAQLESSFVRDHDLRAYDHATASRTVYGTDYSSALVFCRDEIPLINGLRFLYQKMVGLVGHFSGPECLEGEEALLDTLLYECDKTFIEICTALCLLAGEYVPSYRVRAKLLSENYERWFPDLAAALPALPRQVLEATARKLRPNSARTQDPYSLFVESRSALLQVHAYYVRRLYGLQLIPGSDGSRKLLRTLRREYFRVPTRNWLAARKLDNPLARRAVSSAHGRVKRRHYAAITEPGALGTLKALSRDESPNLTIFAAAWSALASISCWGGIIGQPDDDLLAAANATLNRLPGAGSGLRGSGWEAYSRTRERILDAYRVWEASNAG